MRLTSEQEDLRSAVRGLLERSRLSPEPDPAAERALWQRLCTEIGVAGLAIPEGYGGAGAGPLEVHVVMEELGRLLVPSPMLGSAVLATQALLGSQDEAACRRLLPALADGREVAALAWTTADGRFDPADVGCTAERPQGTAAAGAADADNWIVTGQAHYVLDGAGASVLLVPAVLPDGGTGLFEVHPGQPAVTCSACATMDDTRRLAVIGLDGATARRIGGPAALERARDAACIALSAEQVGAAAEALALTVAYTKVRVQFGRPIGGFQALQHRMAELHVLVESARSLSYAAAEAAQRLAPDVGLRAAAAKAYCSEVLQRVSAEMIQLHGAIGMTWEHQAHRYFKRAHGAAMLFGPPASHADRIAAAVVDA